MRLEVNVGAYCRNVHTVEPLAQNNVKNTVTKKYRLSETIMTFKELASVNLQTYTSKTRLP